MAASDTPNTSQRTRGPSQPVNRRTSPTITMTSTASATPSPRVRSPVMARTTSSISSGVWAIAIPATNTSATAVSPTNANPLIIGRMCILLPSLTFGYSCERPAKPTSLKHRELGAPVHQLVVVSGGLHPVELQEQLRICPVDGPDGLRPQDAVDDHILAGHTEGLLKQTNGGHRAHVDR